MVETHRAADIRSGYGTRHGPNPHQAGLPDGIAVRNGVRSSYGPRFHA